MTKETESKQHHWMIAAQVVFTIPEQPEEGGVITLNTMLLTKEHQIDMANLKRANQAIVANFHQKVGLPKAEVLDIIFLNISWIGYMNHTTAMASTKADTPNNVQ